MTEDINMEVQIPKFTEFFNPILEYLASKNEAIHKYDIQKDVVNLEVKKRNLTENIKNVLIKSGGSKIESNCQWGISYLKMAGYITTESGRGMYAITEKGLSDMPVDPDVVARQIRQYSQEKKLTNINQECDSEVKKEIEIAVREQEEDENKWKDDLLDYLRQIEPRDFEILCCKLLTHLGFYDVQKTRDSKDGGFDGSAILKSENQILSTKVLFECKKWAGNVGIDVVKNLHSTVMGKHITKGIIFITSEFTKDAITFAQEIQSIELINGHKLCDLIRKSKFLNMVQERTVYYINTELPDKIINLPNYK